MKRLFSIHLGVMLFIFFGCVPVFAESVQEIGWNELQPAVEFDDPFEKLTSDQLYNLGIVARIRQLQEAGKDSGEATAKELEEATKMLTQEGVDIDGLLARRSEIRDQRRLRAQAVVPQLDGTTIKMGGFILPLEYSGRKVVEFLLVPWVGACIHTPPPPPNQIVHVVVDEKMARESKGLFEPVNVTGTMFTKSIEKNLFLVDGSSSVNVGYSMQASAIEIYKKNS